MTAVLPAAGDQAELREHVVPDPVAELREQDVASLEQPRPRGHHLVVFRVLQLVLGNVSVVAKRTGRGRFRYRISHTVSNRGNFTYRSMPFRRRRNSYTAYTVRELRIFLYRSIPFQPTALYRSIPFHTVPARP